MAEPTPQDNQDKHADHVNALEAMASGAVPFEEQEAIANDALAQVAPDNPTLLPADAFAAHADPAQDAAGDPQSPPADGFVATHSPAMDPDLGSLHESPEMDTTQMSRAQAAVKKIHTGHVSNFRKILIPPLILFGVLLIIMGIIVIITAVSRRGLVAEGHESFIDNWGIPLGLIALPLAAALLFGAWFFIKEILDARKQSQDE